MPCCILYYFAACIRSHPSDCADYTPVNMYRKLMSFQGCLHSKNSEASTEFKEDTNVLAVFVNFIVIQPLDNLKLLSLGSECDVKA